MKIVLKSHVKWVDAKIENFQKSIKTLKIVFEDENFEFCDLQYGLKINCNKFIEISISQNATYSLQEILVYAQNQKS